LKSVFTFIFSTLILVLSAQIEPKIEYIYPVVPNTDFSVTFIGNQPIETFVKKQFPDKNFQFIQAELIESPAGKHYTFQVLLQQIPIENCIVKVHINNTNQVYAVSHNLPQAKEPILLKPVFTANLSDIAEMHKITLQHPIIIFDNQQRLIQGEKIVFINEANSVYKQRIYISANEFYENDLRSFAPDTTLYGKVFLPDPLTTSGEYYGGNYVDGLKKDTSVIVVRAIANPRTSPLVLNDFVFTFQTQSFNVQAANYLNPYSGDTIYQFFESIFFSPQGNVVGYNASISDNLQGKTTRLVYEDYDFEELNAERKWVNTPGSFSGGNFRLENDYFEIQDFSLPIVLPAVSANDTFSFTRSQSGFEDFNAFYHLNFYRNYIENLGFTSLFRKKVFVDTHGNNGADNSFFVHVPQYDTISTNPLVLDTLSFNRLIFGEGGVDDAEDADVVIHEYGHALSFLASPFSNIGRERQALDEGFGDYLAASYSRSFSEHLWQNVFSWDGHNEFWEGRLADTDKNFLDVSDEKNIYFNGEIWSSTLMELWEKLGRTITDKLAIQTMYYNMPNGTFADAANYLLLSDSILHNFENKCDVYNVLWNRKFKNDFCINNQIVEPADIIVLNSAGFAAGSANANIIIAENNFHFADMYISDLMGRKVFEQRNITSRNIEILTANFPAGVYYIRIQTNNKRHTLKLLKAIH
jgi:hypothetical protein